MVSNYDVVVVGGGVCGVLAAQKLGEEGLTYKVVERLEDFGGVWTYRANSYSHLQARRPGLCLTFSPAAAVRQSRIAASKSFKPAKSFACMWSRMS